MPTDDVAAGLRRARLTLSPSTESGRPGLGAHHADEGLSYGPAELTVMLRPGAPFCSRTSTEG